MCSLRSFLAHAAHGTIVMDDVQIYRRWLTAQQRNETQQDNSDS